MPLIMPNPKTGIIPQIHESAFIAPNAVVIGNVIIEAGVNIWFGAVLRGDRGLLKIGKNTSIQENVTIHTEEETKVIIGEDCIIGHHVMIHGPCTIGNGCLVGIGSNVLHESKMGEGSILAAGGVLINKEIPSRTMAVGIPAEVKKKLSDDGDLEGAKTSAEYAENGEIFKRFFEKHPEILN